MITGVSPGGIGETTALGFALGQPKTLVLASRTKVNLEAVAGAIGMKYPKVDVKIVLVDFASQESVRAAAADVKKLVSKIDILVNNAAVVPHSRKWTAEHIELQFGANHIGHFLFTNLLLPLLREAAKDASPGDTRIINVSSGGHNLSPIRFHDYNFEGKPIPDEENPNTFRGNGMNLNNTSEDGYPFFVAYGQCKTANILFSLYLQEHLKSAGITSYALHPGTITTKLGRDSAPPKPGEKKFPPPEWKTKTLDGGASTTLFAALDPDLNGACHSNLQATLSIIVADR